MKKEPSSGGIGTSGLKNAKRSSHGLTIKSCQQSEEIQHTPLDNGGSAGWSAELNGPFLDGLLRSIESGFSTNMEDRQASSRSWCLHTTTYVKSFRGLSERRQAYCVKTQYGNLLRLEPSGESPLLLPANEHKQLIVIDFEYASANLPGLEFANHFTEWCYDYHSSRPYALNANRYPTSEEQHRFLKAYIQHRPPIQARPSISPLIEASQGPSSSISTFMLDSRAPMAQIEEEKRQEETVEMEVKRLVTETRLWQVANSAQWVAWGIVQAKVPGMDEALAAQKCGTPKSEDTIIQAQQKHLDSDPPSPESREPVQNLHEEGPEEGNEEGEFDYLGYAQERAMFFWGDILQLGIVKEEDLPEELLKKVKIVKY